MRIENFFASIKKNKQLTLKYEQSDTAFLTFAVFAAIELWICEHFHNHKNCRNLKISYWGDALRLVAFSRT